eukprot:2517414-Amphidinium_carterae.1
MSSFKYTVHHCMFFAGLAGVGWSSSFEKKCSRWLTSAISSNQNRYCPECSTVAIADSSPP